MPDEPVPGNENQGGMVADTREVIVLEPGAEQAQKIAKAMGSQTAGDILRLLRTGPKTSSEVTEELKIPMGTAKYHIENLLAAGIIEVIRTRYSVKGREVKVYGLKDQVLIVTPGVANVRSLLLKYASLFGIVVIATAVIGIMARMLYMPGSLPPSSYELEKTGAGIPAAAPSYAQSAINEAATGGKGIIADSAGRVMNTAQVANTSVPLPAATPGELGFVEHAQAGGPVLTGLPVQELLFAFFLGGCFVITVLVVYELWKQKKTGQP